MQPKTTVADVLALVEPNKGNVAAIARKLGVSRGTVWNRCQESPTLMRALDDAREAMIDNAESVLYKKVLEGSTPELLFFLKTQGRNRGYVERQELTGKDGGAIEVSWVENENSD
jgi:hypothetical protein